MYFTLRKLIINKIWYYGDFFLVIYEWNEQFLLLSI